MDFWGSPASCWDLALSTSGSTLGHTGAVARDSGTRVYPPVGRHQPQDNYRPRTCYGRIQPTNQKARTSSGTGRAPTHKLANTTFGHLKPSTHLCPPVGQPLTLGTVFTHSWADTRPEISWAPIPPISETASPGAPQRPETSHPTNQ